MGQAPASSDNNRRRYDNSATVVSRVRRQGCCFGVGGELFQQGGLHDPGAEYGSVVSMISPQAVARVVGPAIPGSTITQLEYTPPPGPPLLLSQDHSSTRVLTSG